MSGITADGVKQAQDAWNRISVKAKTAGEHEIAGLQNARHLLKGMGLDLAQDATYELLQDGLTKAAFDQAYTQAEITEVLREYHATLGDTGQYLGDYAKNRAWRLQRIIEELMPRLEESLATTGVPQGLSPLATAELKNLRTLVQQGTLQDEMRQCAQRGAQDLFRIAHSQHESLQQKTDQTRGWDAEQRGLMYATSALELIDLAGPSYKKEQIPLSWNPFSGGGWKENSPAVEFSREAIETLQKAFAVSEIAKKFASAKKFQDEGHFVLDSSGSGHGAMVMPMQDALNGLKKYGFSLQDPATYQAIGTDMATFRACYQLERQKVSGTRHAQLIKPEQAM